MPRFVHHSGHQNGDHTFDAWDCSGLSRSLEDELADEVRRLYVDPDGLRETLEHAAADLDPTVDGSTVSNAVESCVRASVPEPGTHPVPALDLARNEVAEILAFVGLPEIHAVVIPASRLANKDVPRLPARGLDLLGLQLDPLALVLTEAKASSSATSPPGVVCSGGESLRAQLSAFLADRTKIVRELNWAIKHASDAEARVAAAQALLLFEADRLPVVLCPVLLRPSAVHSDQDYGCFDVESDDFAPSLIKFCIFRVERSLEDLAQAIYSRARAE